VALLLVVAACSSDDDGGSDEAAATSGTSSTTSTTAVPAEPTGVIAIGHSGLTGLSADPDHPDASAAEYSWATGDSPDVDSIYQRLIAADPRHNGHVSNAAVNGATVDELVAQADGALEEVPNPALVIVMAVDNDIRCDGTDADNVEALGESFTATLDTITESAPDARVVIVGNQNRPSTFADAVIAGGDVPIPGSSICELFTADGGRNEEGLATLTSIIEAYEAEMDRVCAAYAQCTSAIAEAAAAPISPESIAADGHASIQGHRELAEAVWPVVQRAMGL
jgi:lysophospholipase L1-like esterase